jgi:hypothetical protein
LRFPLQWHPEIQQQDVRLQFEHTLYDICCIVGIANDPKIRLDLKQTPQPLCESWMIVRYDNADGGGNHNLSRLSVRRPNQYLWHFGGVLNSTLVGALQTSLEHLRRNAQTYSQQRQ